LPSPLVVSRKLLDEKIVKIRKLIEIYSAGLSKEAKELVRDQYETAEMVIITPIGNSIFLSVSSDRWARLKRNSVAGTKFENECATISFHVFHEAFEVRTLS
jgi:hypothetical protein